MLTICTSGTTITFSVTATLTVWILAVESKVTGIVQVLECQIKVLLTLAILRWARMGHQLVLIRTTGSP